MGEPTKKRLRESLTESLIRFPLPQEGAKRTEKILATNRRKKAPAEKVSNYSKRGEDQKNPVGDHSTAKDIN